MIIATSEVYLFLLKYFQAFICLKCRKGGRILTCKASKTYSYFHEKEIKSSNVCLPCVDASTAKQCTPFQISQQRECCNATKAEFWSAVKLLESLFFAIQIPDCIHHHILVVFFLIKKLYIYIFRTVTALIIRFNILHFESEPMLFELLLKSRICFHANELSVLNVVVRTNLQILSQYWCLILPHWYKCTAAANSLLAYFSSTQWIFSPLQCLISSSAGQSSWS